MNAVVDAWGFWGFHAAWQAAVVAVVVLAVVWLGRRWPAPVRYGLLLVALAKFALPPIIALPMSPFSYCGPEVAHVEPKAVAPVVFEPPSATFAVPEYEAVRPEPALEPIEPAEFAQATSPQPVSSQPIVPQQRPWNRKLVLLSIHLSGMALVAGWLAVQWLRLRRFQRSSHDTSDERIRERFAYLSQQLGMRRSVRLLIGSNDTVPCSFGLTCPVVIVPETLVSRPSEDLDRVLAHELAHHRRGDLWVNAAQLGLFIVWWFNPIYWLLHRSLRTVREDCCDDLLLAKGIASPGEYCDTILRVASNQKSTGPLAIASSMADYPHPLEKRFRRIMDGSLRRSVRLGWLGLAAVVVLAAVLLPGARGSADPDEETAPEAEVEHTESVDEVLDTPRLGEPRTVVGRVVDESGEPVAGARVWLPLRWLPGNGLTAKAIADDEGLFQLDIAGEWMTEPRIHRYRTTIWAYSPGKRIGQGEALNALFREEEHQEIKIALGPETDTRVIVTKPSGSVAQGVRVVPRYVPGFPLPDELVELVAARTDAQGMARLPACDFDRLANVVIEAGELGRQSARPKGPVLDDAPWKIRLQPVGRVVGRIEGAPEVVSGLRVGLVTSKGFSEVYSDERGRFEVEHLAVGALRVSAALPREGPLRLSIPSLLGVSNGETTEVVLRAERGVLVEGRIVERDTKKPIPGADVRVRFGVGGQSEETVSDQHGRYSARVLPGTVRSVAWAIPGRYLQTDESRDAATAVPGGVDRFDLPTIEAVRYNSLSGRVIDPLGEPVQDALIRVLKADGQPIPDAVAWTRKDGTFRALWYPAEPVKDSFRYLIEKVRPQPIEASVVEAEPLVLRIPPPLNSDTGTTIEGRILDQFGTPIVGASVQLSQRASIARLGDSAAPGASTVGALTTDAEGILRTSGSLKRGAQYQVSVRWDASIWPVSTESEWIEATGPDTSFGDIRVRRIWSLRGEVINLQWQPVAGARLTYRGPTLQDRSTEKTMSATTDAKGRFGFPNLYPFKMPGDPTRAARLEVSAEGYETRMWDAEPANSPDGGLKIVLVKKKPPTALELLQGVERVRTTLPRPIVIEIETQYEDKRLQHVHRNRVIFDGNRYRFRGINDDRVNPCSIFDGTMAMHYDGTSSCTIRPPSKWTADYLFDPKTLGLTALLQPGRDVAACLAYRDAKQILLVGKETMGTEMRAVGDTWHVRVLDKHDQRLDFWIEMPDYRVTKCEYRFNDIYRVANSQWSDRGIFPDKVAIKRYSSNRLVSETTLQTLRMLELLDLPPGIWTLAGLDLPIGTPVVKLGAGLPGYWNGKEVVPSLSESTPK